MSLLSMIQEVCTDPGIGITPPSSVIGNAGASIAGLLNLAQKEGDELSRRHDWQNLVREASYTTIAQEEQTNALPNDVATEPYDRMVYNAQVWNRTGNLRYSGPLAPGERQIVKQGIAGGIIGWWWILGNELHIYPAPAAGQTIATEYITKNWCESDDATTGKKRWAADSDKGRLPERLMTLGIIWRWRRAQGFDYGEEMATYERELEKACSRDRGTAIIRQGRRAGFPSSPGWDQHVDA